MQQQAYINATIDIRIPTEVQNIIISMMWMMNTC
ncbi:DUF3113 family protein [Staphylococcus aureus]